MQSGHSLASETSVIRPSALTLRLLTSPRTTECLLLTELHHTVSRRAGACLSRPSCHPPCTGSASAGPGHASWEQHPGAMPGAGPGVRRLPALVGVGHPLPSTAPIRPNLSLQQIFLSGCPVGLEEKSVFGPRQAMSLDCFDVPSVFREQPVCVFMLMSSQSYLEDSLVGINKVSTLWVWTVLSFGLVRPAPLGPPDVPRGSVQGALGRDTGPACISLECGWEGSLQVWAPQAVPTLQFPGGPDKCSCHTGRPLKGPTPTDSFGPEGIRLWLGAGKGTEGSRWGRQQWAPAGVACVTAQRLRCRAERGPGPFLRARPREHQPCRQVKPSLVLAASSPCQKCRLHSAACGSFPSGSPASYRHPNHSPEIGPPSAGPGCRHSLGAGLGSRRAPAFSISRGICTPHSFPPSASWSAALPFTQLPRLLCAQSHAVRKSCQPTSAVVLCCFKPPEQGLRRNPQMPTKPL